MHKKRALQVAVAGVLSLGITVAQAGELRMVPSGALPSILAAGSISDSDLTYAFEQFDDARTDPNTPLAYPFRTIYKLADNINSLTNDFYVTFTLSDGAAWSTDLQQPNKFRLIKDNGTATAVSIARAAGGAPGESTVTYLVAASKQPIGKEDILDFNFTIKTDKALAAPGGQIRLNAQINLATGSDFTSGKIIDVPQSIAIARSGQAVDIDLPFELDRAGTGFISVEENSLKFTGTAIKDNGLRIDYGSVKIMPSTSGTGDGLLDIDATASLSKSGQRWDPKQEFDRGVLTIKDGNFNASGLATDGNVYIEVDTGDGAKINATSIDLKERTATWELKSADLGKIYSKLRPIYLVVTGATAIDEFRQLETIGTLQVKMKSRNNFIQVSSKLRHLIKNGTVCTLYNIPDSTALDRLNIRVTNDSNTTGFIKGRLRGMDGKDIYAEGTGPYLELISSSGVDALGPNQTKRLTIDQISKSGAYKWTGRAVLTLESNIPDGKLQIFGLLRAADTPTGLSESPLLNMSTGATGNSCD